MPTTKLNTLFRYLCAIILFSVVVVYFAGSSSSRDISVTIDLPVNSVKKGNIIGLNNGLYFLSLDEYSSYAFGVVVDEPRVSIANNNDRNKTYVVTDGDVEILVSSINGQIKKGDFITTSQINGVGMKATNAGPTVGIALEDYNADDPYEVGLIYATLDVKEVSILTDHSENIVALLSSALKSPTISPLVSLRYVLAAALIIFAIAFGLIYFGRIASNSVVSMGRNPTAGKLIVKETILSFILVGGIFMGAILVAYIILSI